MRKLTRRFIISSLDNLNLSKPIRYERYYINDNLRIQKKDQIYEKEILDDNNTIISKTTISEKEFMELKKKSNDKIIRDSYIFLENEKISIKKYYGKYEGLYRVEISFNTLEDQEKYQKAEWLGNEITDSPLAFDKDLVKLSEFEFKEELKKYS